MTARDLVDRFREEGLDPQTWSNGPSYGYPVHDHPYDKVLVVADGAIMFGLPTTAESFDLVVGDRLELPAGTAHYAVVGPRGVTCLEAHVPARGHATSARRPAGEW